MSKLWVSAHLFSVPCVPGYFKYAGHVFKHLRKSKWSQHAENCFQQVRLPLCSSLHHLHSWLRLCVSDSCCKYLWLACSKFLDCHITWFIQGVAFLCWHAVVSLAYPSANTYECYLCLGLRGKKKLWQRHTRGRVR